MRFFYIIYTISVLLTIDIFTMQHYRNPDITFQFKMMPNEHH